MNVNYYNLDRIYNPRMEYEYDNPKMEYEYDNEKLPLTQNIKYLLMYV